MSDPIYKDKMSLIKEAAGSKAKALGSLGKRITEPGPDGAPSILDRISGRVIKDQGGWSSTDPGLNRPTPATPKPDNKPGGGIAGWLPRPKPDQKPKPGLVPGWLTRPKPDQRPQPLPDRPPMPPGGNKWDRYPDKPKPMPAPGKVPPGWGERPKPMPHRPNPGNPYKPMPMPHRPGPGNHYKPMPMPYRPGDDDKNWMRPLAKKASYNYSALVSDARQITDHAFNDELNKIAGKSTIFAKAIKSLKSLGAKAKDVGVKIDKKVQNLGKAVGGKTGLGKKFTKGKGKKAKMSTKGKRGLGYGTIGAGVLGGLGLKELVD